jgi:hypothetical protein
VQRQRSLDLVVVTRQTFLWAAKSEVAHGSVERKDGDSYMEIERQGWHLKFRAPLYTGREGEENREGNQGRELSCVIERSGSVTYVPDAQRVLR